MFQLSVQFYNLTNTFLLLFVHAAPPEVTSQCWESETS